MAGPDSNGYQPDSALFLEMTEGQVQDTMTKQITSLRLAQFSSLDVVCTVISVAKPLWSKSVVSFG